MHKPPNSSEGEGLNRVVHRNIRDTIHARRKLERRRTTSEHMAASITRAAGSMWFAYLHAGWFCAWMSINLAMAKSAFDPFPFVLLTTVVSLEAIFLSLMVLVSQNREAKLDEQRADLDLQIDLLAEHEITRILVIVDAMAKKMGLENLCGAEISDFEKEIRPRDLIKQLEKQQTKTEN